MFDLSDDDRYELKDLRPRKMSKFDDLTTKWISYSLVDVLFAYLFDLRVTDLEHNTCSDQLIGKLSPSLSGLVRFESAKEALCAVIQRSLCYSLYRNFDLAKMVADDLIEILSDRSRILHCLLTLRKRFNNAGLDFVYLFNQLFLDDYCLWIQSVGANILEELAAEYSAAARDVKRADIITLDLDYIESEARMIQLSVENGEYDSDD